MSVLPALQRLVPRPGTSYAAAYRHMAVDSRAAEIRRFVREECKAINYSVGQRLRRLREAREQKDE